MISNEVERQDHLGFWFFSALVIVTGLAAIYLHLTDHTLIEQISEEDGPVEWGTAADYMLATVLFFAVWIKSPRRHWFILVLSMMCFFVAGEEISWGQRILGLHTPAIVAANNVQGEMNIHNLIGIHGIIRLFGVLFVATIFVILPLSVHVSDFCRRTLARMGVASPPLRYCHMPIIAILFQAAPRMMLGRPIYYFNEVGELLLSLAFLAFATALAGATLWREPEEARPGDWPDIGRPVATPGFER